MLSPTLASQPETLQFVRRNIVSGVTDVVINESAKLPMRDVPAGTGYGVLIEILKAQRSAGEVATWLLNVRKGIDPVTNLPFDEAPEWRIVAQERLTSVRGIYRLGLHPERQYIVRNLTIAATDLTLTLPEGMAFVADTGAGVTGLLLHGERGMEFAPISGVERDQLKIFAGSESLTTAFESAFLRMNPNDFDALVAQDALIERTIGPHDFQRAQKLFDEYAPETFTVDLGHLSDETWWVLPNEGDLLIEIQTPHFDNLTYIRANRRAEDIQLFDRERNRHISVYASEAKLATRGEFYSEDDLVDYDVQNYDLEAAFFPERDLIRGQATLSLKAVADLTMLRIRLADALQIRGVRSASYGALFPLRMPGQNSMILNLPEVVPAGTEFTLTVQYEGQVPAEQADHQMILPRITSLLSSSQSIHPTIRSEPEPHYLYGSRSLWYPQSTVTDYATAELRLTVPPGFQCVGTGQLDGPPVEAVTDDPRLAGGTLYRFVASQPIRYLAAVVNEFVEVGSTQVILRDVARGTQSYDGGPVRLGTGRFHDTVELSVEANRRQRRRASSLTTRAEDIFRFYTFLVGDVPYPSLTITMVESELPGGHSPAYMSLLSEPQRGADLLWERDPVYFRGFPDFFLAHELAHQWWGQAVGWNNYHEQWLSEGLAQYFSALYAQHVDGNRVFRQILCQMRDWAMAKSDQGPIYLGYRLGHIQQDSRIFRALVYNKGAVVLHMLRRLVGDEVFFRALRRFYLEQRFTKAGTEDLRRAFEQEADRSLDRFFDRWIHEAGVPELRFDYWIEPITESTDGPDQPGLAAPRSQAVLRFRQEGERLYDVPVTATLKYASGQTVDVVVNVTERTTEMRVPLTGVLRNVDVNRDYAALARVSKR